MFRYMKQNLENFIKRINTILKTKYVDPFTCSHTVKSLLGSSEAEKFFNGFIPFNQCVYKLTKKLLVHKIEVNFASGTPYLAELSFVYYGDNYLYMDIVSRMNSILQQIDYSSLVEHDLIDLSPIRNIKF